MAITEWGAIEMAKKKDWYYGITVKKHEKAFKFIIVWSSLIKGEKPWHSLPSLMTDINHSILSIAIK